MGKNSTTDRPLLIAVAENENVNSKAEQIMSHCPLWYLLQTSGFICSYNLFFKIQ